MKDRRPPDELTREELHRRIIVRARKLIAELEQTIIDVQSWNCNRPDAPPMDCEWEQVTLAEKRRELAEFIARNGDI